MSEKNLGMREQLREKSMCELLFSAKEGAILNAISSLVISYASLASNYINSLITTHNISRNNNVWATKGGSIYRERCEVVVSMFAHE